MSFLNATLIVQAFNFFIGFLFVKYLLFKPVLAQIKAESLFQETLINSVQESQAAIAQKEQELRNQMKALRSYFAQHAPSLKSPIMTEKRAIITFPPFDQKAQEKAIEYMADALVQKVSHGR